MKASAVLGLVLVLSSCIGLCLAVPMPSMGMRSGAAGGGAPMRPSPTRHTVNAAVRSAAATATPPYGGTMTLEQLYAQYPALSSAPSTSPSPTTASISTPTPTPTVSMPQMTTLPITSTSYSPSPSSSSPSSSMPMSSSSSLPYSMTASSYPGAAVSSPVSSYATYGGGYYPSAGVGVGVGAAQPMVSPGYPGMMDGGSPQQPMYAAPAAAAASSQPGYTPSYSPSYAQYGEAAMQQPYSMGGMPPTAAVVSSSPVSAASAASSGQMTLDQLLSMYPDLTPVARSAAPTLPGPAFTTLAAYNAALQQPQQYQPATATAPIMMAAAPATQPIMQAPAATAATPMTAPVTQPLAQQFAQYQAAAQQVQAQFQRTPQPQQPVAATSPTYSWHDDVEMQGVSAPTSMAGTPAATVLGAAAMATCPSMSDNTQLYQEAGDTYTVMFNPTQQNQPITSFQGVQMQHSVNGHSTVIPMQTQRPGQYHATIKLQPGDMLVYNFIFSSHDGAACQGQHYAAQIPGSSTTATPASAPSSMNANAAAAANSAAPAAPAAANPAATAGVKPRRRSCPILTPTPSLSLLDAPSMRNLAAGVALYSVNFVPNSPLAPDWVDLHYSVNAEKPWQANIRMSPGANGKFEYKLGVPLATSDVMSYAFTYSVEGVECDTDTIIDAAQVRSAAATPHH